MTADETVDGIPVVVGVTLSDGTTLGADVVVDAGGRRSDVARPSRPARRGDPRAEEDTGIIYLSRFFRLLDLDETPPVGRGPERTWATSSTACSPATTTPSRSRSPSAPRLQMRRLLLDPDRFLTAAALIPATAPLRRRSFQGRSPTSR